jgi:hypothetical protein
MVGRWTVMVLEILSGLGSMPAEITGSPMMPPNSSHSPFKASDSFPLRFSLRVLSVEVSGGEMVVVAINGHR